MTAGGRWLVAIVVATLASTGGLSCSSVENAADGGPAPAGTGGAGSGGTGGTGFGGNDGAGGAGVDTSCFEGFAGCISTCGAADVIVIPSPYCDAQGHPQCPDGSQRMADCAPDSCARVYNNCCDPITGASGPAPCRPDGVRDVCPASTRPAPDFKCIPDSLGVTDCLDLRAEPCAMEGQRCHGGYGDCWCPPAAASSMTWQCIPFLP